MADIRKQYRFEKTDIPLGILGSKSPAIGVERMDKVKKKEDSKDLGENPYHHCCCRVIHHICCAPCWRPSINALQEYMLD